MKFTVFTPTYNRANTLHRVYESLLDQTFTDFEWLVIDDGSTDETPAVLDHFRRCVGKAFPIVHRRLERNRGKHRAHNLAVSMAQGYFFLVADDDDWITPNALERMDYHWSRVANPTLGGVCGLCADMSGNVIGTRYSAAETFSTLRQRKYIYKMKGEHWGCVRTDICRRYPFPDIDGFVPEGIVWLDIAKTYKDYCVNEVFRIYSS